MESEPSVDWYLDHVLAYAEPDGTIPPITGPAGQWREWWRRRSLELIGDPCGDIARTQGFVATAAQLATAAVPRHRTRRALKTGRWTSPARGVVSPVAVPESPSRLAQRRRHALAATAAALRHPDHAVSDRSAGVLHGLPTLELPRLPQLTPREAATSGRRQAAHVFAARLPPEQLGTWFGAPVTTVARTVVDLARHDRRDGIMAADAALREQLLTGAEIDRALAEAQGWPGVRQARAVLALATPLAESALESITRLALLDDGFSAPELQVCIGGYRVDFLWRDRHLVLEADGRVKYADDALWREKQREDRLRRLGFRIVRVTWSDVMTGWPEVRAELNRLLR